MTSSHVFIVLLFFFYHSINSQSISTTSILNNTTTTSEENATSETLTSTISVFSTTTNDSISTTIKPSETTTTTDSISTTIKPSETTTTATTQFTVSINITSINESTTFTIDSTRPSIPSSKTRRWLIIAPIVTIAAVIAIGIIHYYRRRSPYRRFLQSWRSHDDDRDNIVLQLEEPEVTNSQWPSRLSFA